MFNKTKIIEIDPKSIDQKAIEAAAYTIRRGGLVVYPTDTAYGIAADASNERAVEKLYKVKERNRDKPTHVVVRDWTMISGILLTNFVAKMLHDKFMPGPLTLVLSLKEGIKYPDNLTAGKKTLGARIPDFEVTKRLSAILEVPYTTPSANKEGKKTPYSIEEVEKELGFDGIDMVLDAGELPQNPPSTIVDLSEGPIEIIRPGSINPNEIINLIKKYNFRE